MSDPATKQDSALPTQHPFKLTIEVQGAELVDILDLLYEVERDIANGRQGPRSIGAGPSRHYHVEWTITNGSHTPSGVSG